MQNQIFYDKFIAVYDNSFEGNDWTLNNTNSYLE